MQNTANKLKESFQSFESWQERYQYIIEFGKKMGPMPLELKSEDNQVKGCQSKTWIFCRKNDDGTLEFLADSEAAISKGISALLLSVYSNQKAQDILTFPDSFIKELGIVEHLSMNRSNGLASMLKRIKNYALAYSLKN